MIFPFYYVNCPVMGNEALRAADDIAQVLAARQYADWRELRHEPLTSPAVGKTLAIFAGHIVKALEQVSPARPAAVPAEHTKGSRRGKKQADESEQAGKAATVESSRRAALTKTEPPTLIVDAMHRGHHTTVTAALQAAKPGDRILIRPGLYREGIVIDKPVEIIGDGAPGEVVLEATGKDVILFQANMGRVVNLTLRQMGGGKWFGVDIDQGRLDLEACDITSASLSCIAIHGGADPRLRRNRIHDGKSGGVYVFDGGLGTLEDNEICGNALAGVDIESGSNPTLRRNRIHDNKENGVFAYNNGLGTLEDNDIFGNGYSGVEIRSGANPTLRGNHIHDGKQTGVYVNENGLGTLEDNEIVSNAYRGIEITEGGNPTLRRNTISKNSHQAVRVYAGGCGEILDNDLRGNALGALTIDEDCKDLVKLAGNKV